MVLHELAVEAVGARVRLDPHLADRRKVDRAGELGQVLTLRITRREGADADAVLLREDDALDEHFLVLSVKDVREVVTALRTQLAFDIETVVALDLGA